MKITSKSLWGAIVTAIGVLSQPGVFDVLPKKVAAVVASAGGILTVLGLRTAIAKNGTGA